MIHLNMFDTIDDKLVLYDDAKPGDKFEVVSLLDIRGDEIDDPDEAAGGVVKIAEGQFKVFTFPSVLTFPTEH